MRAGIHVHPILPVGIVGMTDRYGAACGFAAAGDCDNCRALCLGSHLAGNINLRDCGRVARPSQAARCVDGLLHGGELTGRVNSIIRTSDFFVCVNIFRYNFASPFFSDLHLSDIPT